MCTWWPMHSVLICTLHNPAHLSHLSLTDRLARSAPGDFDTKNMMMYILLSQMSIMFVMITTILFLVLLLR